MSGLLKAFLTQVDARRNTVKCSGISCGLLALWAPGYRSVLQQVGMCGLQQVVKETVGKYHANTKTFRDFHNRLYRMSEKERLQKSYAYLPQIKSQ